MKIGLFGGSFNPIHNGHLGLAGAATRQFGLEQVLFVPCRVPPHKPSPLLAPAIHRMEMCRIATQGVPGFMVSDIEQQLPEPSYTLDTLTELRRRHPGNEWFLIIGADMLLTFQKWHRWQEFAGLATLLAAARELGQRQALEHKARELADFGLKAQVFDLEVIELSSTVLRGMIAQGESTEGLLPAGVREYIDAHSLYL